MGSTEFWEREKGAEGTVCGMGVGEEGLATEAQSRKRDRKKKNAVLKIRRGMTERMGGTEFRGKRKEC